MVGTKSCYGKAVGVILLLVFVHACTIVVRSFQELVLVLLMHIVMRTCLPRTRMAVCDCGAYVIDFDQGFGRACTRTFQQASARGCAPDRDRPIVSNTQSMCFARIVAKIVRDLEIAARETPNF